MPQVSSCPRWPTTAGAPPVPSPPPSAPPSPRAGPAALPAPQRPSRGSPQPPPRSSPERGDKGWRRLATLRHVTATLRRRQFQTAEQTESSGARPHPRPPAWDPLPSRDPPGFPTPPAPPGTRPAWRESLSGTLARSPGWRSPEPALGATAQQRRRLQSGGERELRNGG